MRKIKQINRKNKLALYVHLDKKTFYLYLPENAEIIKDKNGYVVVVKGE